MAKVSKTITNKFTKFSVGFSDGRKVVGNWSGSGVLVTVEPYDGGTVREVSGMFALAHVRGYENNLYNPSQFIELVAAAGEKAPSLDDFVSLVRDSFEKAFGIDMHAPFEAKQRPSTTASYSKKGRGWNVDAKFANGDEFVVTINGRSVSYGMKPPISGLKAEISKLAFAGAAIMDGEAVAKLFADEASRSSSVEDWIDNIRAAYAPAPRN